MSDVKTIPNVGPVVEIEFSQVEQKYLFGMCGTVYQQTKRPESQAVWGLLAKKVSGPTTLYSTQECELLSKAIDTTLSAGDNILSRIQDLEARVRAQAVMSMFRTIKQKIAGSGPTTEGSKNEPARTE